MSDLIQFDGPVPAWFRIEDTTHGLECETCRTCARHAAAAARTYGSAGHSMECTDGYDIDHFAAVHRLS